MSGRSRAALLLVAGVPLLVLLVFFAVPVAGMVSKGFWSGGSFDPAGVGAALGSPHVLGVLWFTVWSAAAATVVTVLLGLPTTYALHRLAVPGRGLLRALVMVPFVLPTVVVGVAFDQVFGQGGPLGWLHLGGTAVAIVVAMVFFNVGVVVRTVGAFWESMDPRREQAAAALGASPRQVWWTVTLPALLPSVAAAASVVFLFCATAFGVVLTMGGLRYSNVETEVYLLTTQELDLRGAAALSLLQLVIIVLLLAGIGRVRRHQAPVERGAAPVRRPGTRDLPSLVVAGCTVLFLLLPLVSLLQASLTSGGHWTLANFRRLQGNGAEHTLLATGLGALRTSLELALAAAAMAVVLGLLVSYVVSRRPSGPLARRLVGLFDGVFMLPLGVSAVTLGFGFLITLNRPPLDLRTSPVLIPIAQALVALPLVVRTVAPVWRSVDQRQREAAASLGAGPGRVFATVDLPTAVRPVLAATGFAFAVSLGEFGATSFLARTDHVTLPVVIYQLLGQPGPGDFGMAMAASVVLAAATAAVMFLVERLRVGSMGAF
ncbi:MAG: ABC transporter permease [Marmoricola sp.]